MSRVQWGLPGPTRMTRGQLEGNGSLGPFCKGLCAPLSAHLLCSAPRPGLQVIRPGGLCPHTMRLVTATPWMGKATRGLWGTWASKATHFLPCPVPFRTP